MDESFVRARKKFDRKMEESYSECDGYLSLLTRPVNVGTLIDYKQQRSGFPQPQSTYPWANLGRSASIGAGQLQTQPQPQVQLPLQHPQQNPESQPQTACVQELVTEVTESGHRDARMFQPSTEHPAFLRVTAQLPGTALIKERQHLVQICLQKSKYLGR
jgi:hypothetical protein